MTASPWIAAVVALVLWWLSTGVILFAVRRAEGRGTLRRLAILSLPVLLAGVVALGLSLPGQGAAADYAGFVSALAIWGWIELAFLTGLVTGPGPLPAPDGVTGWDRFVLAWRTVAYHELLLAAALGLILLSSVEGNPTAALTFAVLFAARISAKLNLFLGVPRHHADFLPGPLLHLPSHMRIRRLNWLFPASITLLTAAAALFGAEAAATGEVRFALLSAIAALACLEHWLMVLPLPDEKLWRWALAPKTDRRRPT